MVRYATLSAFTAKGSVANPSASAKGSAANPSASAKGSAANPSASAKGSAANLHNVQAFAITELWYATLPRTLCEGLLRYPSLFTARVCFTTPARVQRGLLR
jgi:hypothetical protein